MSIRSHHWMRTSYVCLVLQLLTVPFRFCSEAPNSLYVALAVAVASSFLGLRPVEYALAKMFCVQELYIMNHSATLVQTLFRGVSARAYAQAQKIAQKQFASRKIQRSWRHYLLSHRIKAAAFSYRQRYVAALRLLTWFRRLLRRRKWVRVIAQR
jgi:hypothetical protein